MPTAPTLISPLARRRIAVYTDDPGEGGVAIYVHALLMGLANLNADVTCIQSKFDGPLQKIHAQAGIKHHWLPFHTRKEFVRTATNIPDAQDALAAANPEVVLFANCDPFSHIAAKQAATARKIPFVVVEGYAAPIATIDASAAWFLRFTEDQYWNAKAVIAVSQDNLEILHKHYGLPPCKGEIIHYGRSPEYFQPPDPAIRQSLRGDLGITDDAIVSLTIGRLETIKGHEYLIAAIQQLRAKPIWPKLHFVWIGGGSQETAIRDAITRAGLADRVHILGHRWDVARWYDAADLFVLSSRCEGMPLAIMEAMAKGLPVIASAVSGIPEELGDTGRLITSPNANPQAASFEIAATIEQWAANADIRHSISAAGRLRADAMFTEQRMVDQTANVLHRALLPAGDYISPGLRVIQPDACFPNMVIANPKGHPWPHLRWEIPHNWYQDKRAPGTGFANRDEASILYNTALKFTGRRALEIGCWLGWSACHLALGGVVLDVIDPALSNPRFLQSAKDSLAAAGVLANVNLITGASPAAVADLAGAEQRRWPLIFIDGNHEGLAPVFDAAVCAEFAEPDALILFHDLASPDVAGGLEYLRRRGWKTIVYSTMQIMAAAWRGNVQPIIHCPDPDITWNIPGHLREYEISGMKK